jgi:hypothetical protein
MAWISSHSAPTKKTAARFESWPPLPIESSEFANLAVDCRGAVRRNQKERRGGLMENIARTLENEYTIVRLLSDKGLPVPRPLWLEMNESLPRRRFRGSGPSAR